MANESVTVTQSVNATVTATQDVDSVTVSSASLPSLTSGGTVTGDLNVTNNVDVDGTLETDALTINGVTLSETIADTVGAMVGSNTETGIAVSYDDSDNTLDFELAASQTSITSILNTGLTVGRDSDDFINFAVDNQISFEVAGTESIFFKASGEIEATSLDISGDVDVDGTLEADAITVEGVALATFVRDTVGTNMLSGNTESGITVTYDTSNDNIDFAIDAAQTGITSLLATDIKIGEDDETKIDFETADEIHFYAANVEQVYLADNIFGPQSDSDVDLGSSSVRWKDAYVDSVTSTGDVSVGGNLVVNGSTVTVNSTTVTVDDPIFTLGGDTAPGVDDNKDRGIEFRYHTGSSAKVGFFGYDDSASAFTFIPDASNSSEVFSGSAGKVIFGEVEATSLDISGDADIDGTLEADAITVDGVTLSETIADTVGAMVSGNTESGITVTYDDSDNTLDFAHNDTSSVSSADLSDGIVIQDLTVDTYGHVTGIGSVNLDSRFLALSGGNIVGNVDIDGDLSIDGSHQIKLGTGSSGLQRRTDANLELVVSDNSGQINLVTLGSAGGKAVNFKTHTSSAASATTVASVDESGNLSVTGEISSDGDVGIGTSAPSFTSGGGLQISHATQANVRLSDSSDASYNTDVAMSGDDFYLINRSSTGDLKFRVDGSTEAMTVIPSGNVGIGTATPQEQLHLYGASAAKMEIESAGGGDASLKFQVSGQSWSAGIDNGDGDKFKINTGSNPGSAEMLAIDSSGNVGVGTASPARRLTVHDSGAVYLNLTNDSTGVGGSTGLLFGINSGGLATIWNYENTATRFATNNTERLRIDSSGNVGIGTTSPAAGIHLKGDENNIRIQQSDAGSVFNGIEFATYDGTVVSSAKLNQSSGEFRHYNSSSYFPTFYSNNGEAMRIDTSGRVGIGTTAPAKTLDVDGDVRVLDGHKFFCGDGDDLEIYHNATNSFITNKVGDLTISNEGDDKDIIFQSDDGSGGTETYFFLDGSANGGSNPYTIFPDNSILAIGDSKDLLIWHNATNSYVQNFVGDLHIENYADDKDILFRCDDGSGGLETYFFLDGSASSGNPLTQFPDLSQLAFGDSQDLLIRHDGTDSIIQNNGGDFIITQHTNDKDLIFKCDDGSGGVETYFFLDGSASSGNPFTVFPDNSLLAFGSGRDFILNHNGSNTNLGNYTGDIEIVNYANDEDIIFKTDDGSGGTAEYFRLDGSAAGSGNLFTIFPDSSYIGLGSNGTGDFIMAHNGTNTTFANYTGDLQFTNNTDDGDMIFRCDDGSGGVETYFFLDGSTGYTQFPDNKRLALGSSDDFQIFHDALDSKIENSTGHIYVTNFTDDKDIIFQTDDGSGGVTPYITLDGSAEEVVFSKPLTVSGEIKGGVSVSEKTADYTLVAADNGTFISGTHANFDDLSITGDLGAGFNVTVMNPNADLDITASNSMVINGTTNGTVTLAQGYQPATIIRIAANTYAVFGNLL